MDDPGMRSKLPHPGDHDTDRGAGRQPLAHRQVGEVVVDHQARDLVVGQDLVCDAADVLPPRRRDRRPQIRVSRRPRIAYLGLVWGVFRGLGR